MHYKMVLRHLCVVLLLVSVSQSQKSQNAMTNQDVIDMVSIGLSDDVIIEKIHATSATEFDTSVRGLKSLKAAKSSDAVIRVMINPHLVASSLAPAVSNAADPALPPEVGVAHCKMGISPMSNPRLWAGRPVAF